jgi:serine/threonine-protein kinase
VLGCWRLTALVHRGDRLLLFRARPVADDAGPGCYLLKTPRPDRTDGELAFSLLRLEAAASALVSHPHLTTVLSAALDGSLPHIALPYLDGVSLRRMLTGRLPTFRGLWIARQLAEALAALHSAGWLHGQVRPEHAIASPQGHVTLIDLSQARRPNTVECASTWSAPLAPAYAPPEAFLERGELTNASDVYCLGILLFELLTGQPPFAVRDSRQAAWSHCRLAPADVRERVPTVSRDVAELVRRMLAKEPLRRPSAAELVDRLAGLEIAELL